MTTAETLASRITNSTQGDQVYIQTEDGEEYTGSVYQQIDATVYIQDSENNSIEIRIIRPDDTVIVFAYDGKVSEDNGVTQGYNKNQTRVTNDSTKLSFDKIVTEYKVSSEPLTLG